MHVGVNLSPEEFSKLHNALCHLGNLASRVSNIGHGEEAGKIQAEVDAIREVLKPAYDADTEMFDTLHAHYHKVGEEFGAQTTWSMYEVPDLHAKHDFQGVGKLLHKHHWGDDAVEVDIQGDTWADLYIAADKAIKLSGDLHHSFIEGFEADPEEGVMILLTGS